MKVFRILLLLLTFTSAAVAQDAKTVRALLVRAVNNKATADSVYIRLKAAPQTPLNIGFTGAVKALQAKHAWNPFVKVSYVKDAEALFAQAIQQDPTNIELRFMRFSVEHYVPGFLGFDKNLTADRDVMIDQLQKRHFGTADNVLVNALMKFLLESKRCTPMQETYLRKHLKETA